MKNLHELDRWRDFAGAMRLYGTPGSATEGVFMVPCPATGRMLRVIATSGEGWDHVSVSLRERCPNWTEMEFVKRQFFKDDETAMQLHVPPSDHRNCHPYCLHLWRPLDREIPRPPAIFVAPADTPEQTAKELSA